MTSAVAATARRLLAIHYWWTRRDVVRAVLAYFLLIFASTSAFEYLWNRSHPPTWWATYYSVEPVQAVFREGDPIVMRTKVEVHRPVTLNFHDVLQCRVRGDREFRYVSDYDSRSRHPGPKFIGFGADLPVGVDPSIPTTPGKWEYGGRLPQTPSLCRVQSDIDWSPSPGVSKEVQIESGVFMVVPSDEPGGEDDAK